MLLTSHALHVSHTQFFLVRVWLKWRSRPQDRIVGLTSVMSLKQFPFVSYVLFRTLLDPPHSALAPCHSTSPSLLFPSTSTSTTTSPTGLLFGRLAEQSPLTHHHLNGMAGGQVLGGTSRGSGRKDESTTASSPNLVSVSDGRHRWPPERSGDNSLTAQSIFLFLRTLSLVELAAMFVKTSAFVFSPQ